MDIFLPHRRLVVFGNHVLDTVYLAGVVLLDILPGDLLLGNFAPRLFFAFLGSSRESDMPDESCDLQTVRPGGGVQLGPMLVILHRGFPVGRTGIQFKDALHARNKNPGFARLLGEGHCRQKDKSEDRCLHGGRNHCT